MQTYTTKKKQAAPEIQGKAAENISKSEMLHLSGAGTPQPMSPALREKFEPGFGADFSNIRISRGHIPEEMGVQAVAKGTDILIDSHAGMDVLGHELAHVVQQAQGQVQGGFPVVHNAALEHQADVMGARAASGLSAVEGGMSGFGGEMMSIAPMSDASAPAQCKSKEEKAAEKAAKSTTRGDLFKEDYASKNMAGQVEMLRNYAYISSISPDTVDQSEQKAYTELLGQASPEMMDMILENQYNAGLGLEARQVDHQRDEQSAERRSNILYGRSSTGAKERAAYRTSTSEEADKFQSYNTLLKNIGSTNNENADEDSMSSAVWRARGKLGGYNRVLNVAQNIITNDDGTEWAKKNAEAAGEMDKKMQDRRAADAKKWNDSRNAILKARRKGKK